MEDQTVGCEHGLIGTSLEVEQLDMDLCVAGGTPRTFDKSSDIFRFRSKTLFLPTSARGVFGGQVRRSEVTWIHTAIF